RAAVLRGLRARLDERWATMPAMLGALARASRRRYWPLVAPAAIAVGVAAVAWGATRAARDPVVEQCSGSAHAFGDVWSDARRDDVRRALSTALPDRGASIFEEVDKSFAKYRDAWMAAHRG